MKLLLTIPLSEVKALPSISESQGYVLVESQGLLKIYKQVK